MPSPSTSATPIADPGVDRSVDAARLRAGLARCGTVVARHAAGLTRLDAVLGDGDHGDNLVIGFRAVDDLLADLPAETPPGDILRAVGHRLVAAVGGASGPLYGTACIEAGFVAGDAPVLDGPTVAAMLRAAADGLARRGRCRPGDKTILDTLEPAAMAFEASHRARRGPRRRVAGPRSRPARPGCAPRATSSPGAVSRCASASGRSGIATRARSRASCCCARWEAGERTSRRSWSGSRRSNGRARRAFEDAQREADALFAQYQLSQLLASGGSLDGLGRSVALEAGRLGGVDRGAVWLGTRTGPGSTCWPRSGATRPRRRSRRRRSPTSTPAGPGRRALPGARALVLSDDPPTILLCLWASDGREPDPDGVRIAQLARHELAVAFHGARLRETLERERGELTAVVDGTTDLIVQVDAERRVVRLNPAGERLLGISAADAIGRTCDDVLGCAVVGRPRRRPPARWPRSSRPGEPVAYRETAVRGADGSAVQVAGGYSAVLLGARGPGAAVPTPGRRRSCATSAPSAPWRSCARASSRPSATSCGRRSSLIRGYAETLLHLELDAGRAARLHRADRRGDRPPVGARRPDPRRDPSPGRSRSSSSGRRSLFAALVARLRGDLEASGRADRLVVDAARRPAARSRSTAPASARSSRTSSATRSSTGRRTGLVDDLGGGRRRVARRWRSTTRASGIPAAERPLVTEPFHRAWNVRESRIPGTGLGLFICRRLVEAHGGRLRLEDRPDGRAGTRVAFGFRCCGPAGPPIAPASHARPRLRRRPWLTRS